MISRAGKATIKFSCVASGNVYLGNVKLKSDEPGRSEDAGEEAFDCQVDFNEEEGIDD